MKNTVVLTESQRGILQIALEIARDRFKDHVRTLSTEWHDDRFIAKFEEQAEDAETDSFLNSASPRLGGESFRLEWLLGTATVLCGCH